MLRNFGKLLTLLRGNHQPRMTQERLIEEMAARGYHVSRTFVANIETNRTKPSPALLKACEAIFGLPEGALLGLSISDHIKSWCDDNGITIRRGLDLAESALPIAYFLEKHQVATALQRIKEMPGKIHRKARKPLP